MREKMRNNLHAGGENAKSQNEHEKEREKFLHFHSSFLKIWTANHTIGWQFHPSDGLSIIFPVDYSIKLLLYFLYLLLYLSNLTAGTNSREKNYATC